MRENRGRWSVKFAGATAIAMLIVGVVTTTTPVDAQTQKNPVHTSTITVSATSSRAVARAGTRTTARWSHAVDTSNLAAVDNAYRTAYAPKLTQLIDWIGGSVLGCLPGLSSLLTNNSTLSSLNFVRSMAGLAQVVFSPSLNIAAQRAALMMAANNTLSHDPPSNWKCWTKSGATSASRSDLILAYPSLTAGQVISLYMSDPGTTNYAAGHRRWILYPFTTVMGNGSTNVSNALTVIGPSNANRPNPRWVGWPTAGYFPNPIEPDGRWSLSSGLSNVSFAHAKVSVFKGYLPVHIRQYGIHVGYGQPTVVWQMPSGFDKSASYRVVVTGVKQAGVARPLRAAYVVRLFTPSR
jgi:uncharacterized protein YkwD